MEYFVTLHGNEVKSNLTRKQAVKEAVNILKSQNIGMILVGIGVFKIKRGQRMYNILPCSFYFDDDTLN